MNDSPFDIKNPNGQWNLSHGFLPLTDPIHQLPESFALWDEMTWHLPKLIFNRNLREMINVLPPFPTDFLSNGDECERAMMVLSYLAHAYVWAPNQEPAVELPENLAIGWYEVSKKVNRPPVLSYASYASYNWYRLDPDKPVALDNIALLQNFAGGIDEEWFILIHVAIEYAAIPALETIAKLPNTLSNKDNIQLLNELQTIHAVLEQICIIMEAMPEHCDPYCYYQRVRPYIHGWKGNPALPNGLIYRGVKDYHEKPQQFKGETGAQSTIIPVMDAVLGVKHRESSLKTHLDEMENYMPPQHRDFLNHVRQQLSVRDYICTHAKEDKPLKELYNSCLKQIERFRKIHINYAASYINKQHQNSLANATDTGTGGTPFMAYLKLHEEETEAHLL